MILALTAGQVDLGLAQVRRHDGTVRPLSDAEVRLLERLLAEAPRTVPHAELPGPGALNARIFRLRAKLERDPHRPDHLLTSFGEGYRLIGARPLALCAPEPLVGPGPLHGRDALVAKIRTEAARLVWLTGPPGVGKTAVARAALAGQRGVLVDLAAASDLRQAVAGALGVPRAELARHLATAEGMWLLLDNAEFLHAQLEPVVRGWLAAGRVRVLVTSRLEGAIDGAAVIGVPPLDGAAAEALLLERTADVRPGLLAARSEVGALLAQLGGLPLAIELAAARLSALPVSRLVALVAERTDVLASRVRSVDAAIATSWDLLAAADQHALRAVSLFEGDFDLADAAALLGEDAPARLQALVAASLVQVAASLVQDSERFRVLVPIRSFARARSVGADAMEPVARAFVAWLDVEDPSARRHADRVAALQLARALPVPERVSSLTRAVSRGSEAAGVPPAVRSEVVRASLAVPDLGAWDRARLLAQLAGLVDGPEAMALADEAVALAEGASDDTLCDALAIRGDVGGHLGRLAEAEADLGQALAVVSTKSAFRRAWLLRSLAEVVRRRGRVREARDLLREALGHTEKADAAYTLLVLLQLAATEAWLGRYAAAQRHRELAARSVGQFGATVTEFNALSARAAWARERGDLEDARHCYLQAATLPSVGPLTRWHTEGHLALIDEVSGALDASERRLERIEAALAELGDEAYVAETLAHRARVVMRRGQVDRAAAILEGLGEVTELDVRVQVAGLEAEVAARRGDAEGARSRLQHGFGALADTEMVDARNRLAIQACAVARVLGEPAPLPAIPEVEHSASLRALLARVPA